MFNRKLTKSYSLVALLLVLACLYYGSNATEGSSTPSPRKTRAIIDDIVVGDDLLYDELIARNGTRLGRSVPGRQQKRSSSFRLEDNGSKLHYLRVPHNEVSFRG